MPTHCFYSDILVKGSERVLLSPEESRHAAKVLRLAAGDNVTLLNGRGLVGKGEIESVGRRGDEVVCAVSEVCEVPASEPSVRLYVAPPKGKNMDLVLKSATELGVSRITPIICRYGVSRPDGGKDAWNQAVVAACKQSRNPWFPVVDAPLSFEEAIGGCTEVMFLGAVPRAQTNCREPDIVAMKSRGVSLWIGPEGGFDQEEEGLILEKGAFPLTVGRWILRVETAVPALLGNLHAIINR